MSAVLITNDAVTLRLTKLLSFSLSIRRALLKYATESDKDPKWTSAWSETQPKTIYSAETDEGQDGQSKDKET